MTTITKPAPANTYAAAYAILGAIADRLKGAGTAATIDTLADDVRAARQAYGVCRARLDAIRAEIDVETAAVREADAPSAGE